MFFSAQMSSNCLGHTETVTSPRCAVRSIAHATDELRFDEWKHGGFTTLQRREIESMFLYFHDENHWALKTQDTTQRYAEVLGWLDRETKTIK